MMYTCIRSLRALPLLALSSVAFAGGPNAFTLSGPTTVYLGAPVTFDVSGEPSFGASGLFVADTDSVGTPACPPPLLGDCLTIPTPSPMISTISFATPGAHSFTVTPPLGAAPGTYVLQAAAVSGGAPWLSNTVTVNAVDSCASYIGSDPVDGSVGVPVDTWPMLRFSGNTSELWTYTLSDGVSSVPVEVITGGTPTQSIAVLAPFAALDEATTYTVSAENLCGEVVTSTFTTSSGPFDLGDIVGTGFVLETDNAVILGADLLGLSTSVFEPFDNAVAYKFLSYDSGSQTGTVLQGRVDSITGLQDMCGPTKVYDVDFSGNPTFDIFATNYAGLAFPFHDTEALVHGELTPGSDAAVNLSFTLGLPIHLFSPGTLPFTSPCPVAGVECFNISVLGITSHALEVPLVPTGPGTCP